MDIGSVRQIHILHQRAVVGVAQHQVARQHAVTQDALAVIKVVQEQVDGGDPLDHPALDMCPLGRRDNARNDVEGKDTVDRILLRIDGEGDAQVVQLRLRRGGTLPQ